MRSNSSNRSGTNYNASVSTNVTLISAVASGSTRKGFTIYNEGSYTLYVNLNSAAASATSYTVQIPPGGYYEGPYGYTGAVTAFANTATQVRVTEFT